MDINVIRQKVAIQKMNVNMIDQKTNIKEVQSCNFAPSPNSIKTWNNNMILKATYQVGTWKTPINQP